MAGRARSSRFFRDVSRWRNDPRAFELSEHQKVFVAGDEEMGAGPSSTFQEDIVARVSADLDGAAELDTQRARKDEIKSRIDPS